MKPEKEIRGEIDSAKDEMIKAAASQDWATAIKRESYIHGLKYALGEPLD